MVTKLLLILLLSFSFTQEVCEGTCFSEEEVINMTNNIKELQFKREVCESAYLNFERPARPKLEKTQLGHHAICPKPD